MELCYIISKRGEYNMTKYIPLRSFKTKEDRERYVRGTLHSEGLEMIGSYKNNSTPIQVKIQYGEYKGYIGVVKWGNFTQGKRPDFRSLLDEEKVRLLTDGFTKEGYTVVSMPNDVKVTDKIDLISPSGNEWSVSYDTFRAGVRCPLDSNKSWGERCVGSILKQNGIDYETQKTIFHEDGSKQYMDFYIEYGGLKFDVEYHGRQHYHTDPNNRLFLPVEEQKAKDKKKEDYCKINGIIYVEIPYTIREINEIARALKLHIPIIDANKEYTVEHFNNDKEIAEYYMTHTEEETAKRFGLAGVTVRNIAYRLGYKKNGNYNEAEVLEYYKTHTAQETANRFGITKDIVSNLAKKTDFRKVVHYNHEEVIAYYMDHSLKETTDKFGISRQGIQKIMNKHGIKKKRK